MKNNQSDIKILQKINSLMKENKIEDAPKDTKKIDEPENLEITDNINIDLLKSDETYKSMFSIISVNEDKEKGYSFENLEDSSNSKDSKNKIYSRINSDISLMSVDTIKNNTISFWDFVKLKINDIKNHLFFNYNIFLLIILIIFDFF